MPRTTKHEDWYSEAAEHISHTGVSLKAALVAIGGPELSDSEIANVIRRKSWIDCLRAAKLKYQSEVGSDPNRSKASLVDKLELMFDALAHEGAWEKAANVAYQIGRLEGWIGSESNTNIFSGLTAEGLRQVREKLEAKFKPTPGTLQPLAEEPVRVKDEEKIN
jgi:hypothetical protein